MNIYENALFVVRNMEIYKGEGRTAIKALERAKKVEELLGLYREYYGHIPYSNSPRIKYCEEKIDELEKELEEMK